MIKQSIEYIKDYSKGYVSFRFRLSTLACTYFIYKFILYFMAQISFSLPLNLSVLLLCFVKVNYGILKRLGGIFLSLFALYVLYHDSYLPSFSQAMVMSQGSFSEQLDFWSGYLVSVFEIKLLWILAGVFLICLFLHSNIHFGTVIIMLFLYLLYVQVQGVMLTNSEYSKLDNINTVSSPDIAPQIAKNPAKAESAEIENYVQAFLKSEKSRLISFPQTLGENYQPFDVLIVNICSMATDDVIASNLLTHKLFSKFDFSFENFDSVSSYSTPASLRLLRMNCGQQSEAAIYSGRRSECELISSLEVLGFQSQVYFDHNGVYGSYLKYLHELAGLSDSIYPLSNLRVKYQSFDGSPIYSDRDLFEAYANRIEKNSVPAMVTFMNILSLHDGNRLVGQKHGMPYSPRLKTLLDDLDYLVERLEKGGRNTLLIMLPEHGAAIRGDKMQIAKLREIPTDTITRIPVMVRYIKPGEEMQHKTVNLKGQYSYMAISELIRRSLENNVFSKQYSSASPDELVVDLPQTAFVSESTNAFFMNFASKDYYKLKGEEWLPYQK